MVPHCRWLLQVDVAITIEFGIAPGSVTSKENRGIVLFLPSPIPKSLTRGALSETGLLVTSFRPNLVTEWAS